MHRRELLAKPWLSWVTLRAQGTNPASPHGDPSWDGSPAPGMGLTAHRGAEPRLACMHEMQRGVKVRRKPKRVKKVGIQTVIHCRSGVKGDGCREDRCHIWERSRQWPSISVLNSPASGPGAIKPFCPQTCVTLSCIAGGLRSIQGVCTALGEAAGLVLPDLAPNACCSACAQFGCNFLPEVNWCHLFFSFTSLWHTEADYRQFLLGRLKGSSSSRMGMGSPKAG